MDLPERRTLERGALVTALVLLFGRTEAEAESRVRGELLADLVSGRDLDPDRLRERARQQGADLDGGLAVAVAEPAATDPARPPGRRRCWPRELRGLGGSHEGQVVVLAPGEPLTLGATRCRRGWRARPSGSRGCTGGRPGVPDGLAGGPAEPRRPAAAGPGRRGQRPGRARARPAAARRQRPRGARGVHRGHARAGARLRRATRDTGLAETLEAWFAAGGALRETAERLHIHPNTVTQRLDRVGQLLGDDLAGAPAASSTCSWRCRWCGCAAVCEPDT